MVVKQMFAFPIDINILCAVKPNLKSGIEMELNLPHDCPYPKCPLVNEITMVKDLTKSIESQLFEVKGNLRIVDFNQINFQKFLDKFDRVAERLGENIDQLSLLTTSNTEKITNQEMRIGETKTMAVDLQEKLDAQSDKILESMNSMKKDIMLELNDLKRTTSVKISRLEMARNVVYGAILVIVIILTPIVNRLLNPQQHTIYLENPTAAITGTTKPVSK